MSRDGFTLVEVLVALTLAGLSVGMAMGVFVNARDAVALLERRSAAFTARSNAETWLAEAFLSAQVDPEAQVAFEGESDRVRFRTRLWVARGWTEWSDVELRAVDGRLLATASPGDDVSLGDSVASVSFDYLEGTGLDAPWRSEWHSDRTLPTGVRLRLVRRGSRGLEADTLLFLVGAPGP